MHRRDGGIVRLSSLELGISLESGLTSVVDGALGHTLTPTAETNPETGVEE